MSWAEDEGIDFYDPDMEFDPYIEDENVWVNAEGPQDWSELDTEHVAAIVRGLKDGKWEKQAHKLERAERELKNRNPPKWWQA